MWYTVDLESIWTGSRVYHGRLVGDATDRSHDLRDRPSLCFHNFISSHPFCVIIPSGLALILSHTLRVLSVLLPLIRLLLGFYVSLRRVISVPISSSLPVPFCRFRFNDIPAPSFHFDIPRTPTSLRGIYEHIPRLHSPYLSLPYLDLPLLLSVRAYLGVSAPSPRLTGLSSHEGRVNHKL